MTAAERGDLPVFAFNPDAYELSKLNLPFNLWHRANLALGIETLGQKRSYVHYGQDWAEVSNTPFASFKGAPSEGGLRVPFIVSYPGACATGRHDRSVRPRDRLLADHPGHCRPFAAWRRIKGQEGDVRPTGTSMLPYLEGKAPSIHPASYSVGFERTGADSWFAGDHKMARNGPPFGDGKWRLFDIRSDPTQATDLSVAQPELMQKMLAE